MDKLGIIGFAKSVLGKHLFDYEVKKLLNYEELMGWASFNEWIRPPVKNQYLYSIWLRYQEYLNGALDIA